MRFNDFEYSSVPGPGMYKMKGFADETVEKATKFNQIVNQSPLKNNDFDNQKMEGIDIIEEKPYENDS